MLGKIVLSAFFGLGLCYHADSAYALSAENPPRNGIVIRNGRQLTLIEMVEERLMTSRIVTYLAMKEYSIGNCTEAIKLL